ncbi:MAG: TetR/AcrR family transcriptional regulator, partial [Loigolactobacillus coryniformis]|nr:TetR/AcrR family transcriptional regulator [Loigolactobacillus coryniformis]
MGKTRRRGVVLEAAIYQAVREIIDQDGIEAVTFQKVAAAAGTSKPVIYRRWDTPFELAIAAIQDKIRQDNQGRTDELVLTGTNLREDLLQVLQRFLISVNTFG